MNVVLTDPPSPQNPIIKTRRGPHAHLIAVDVRGTTEKGEVSLMELTNQDELKAHLMETNEQFKALAEQHAQLKKKLEAIEAKPHLSISDEDEEHQIKKQKLRLKDQMNEILAQHRAQQVA